MARRKVQVFSLSLLDLLCCAFGGVIVLAVIFSAIIKNKKSIEKKSFLFISAELKCPTEKPCDENTKERISNTLLAIYLDNEDNEDEEKESSPTRSAISRLATINGRTYDNAFTTLLIDSLVTDKKHKIWIKVINDRTVNTSIEQFNLLIKIFNSKSQPFTREVLIDKNEIKEAASGGEQKFSKHFEFTFNSKNQLEFEEIKE
jgi:hypothetical protein